MMKKKWIVTGVIVAALLAGLDLGAPKLAQAGIYQALAEHMEIQPQDVSVTSSPGIEILTGHIDDVQASGDEIRIGKLRVQHMDCNLHGVQFNPIDSVTQHKLVVTSAQSGELNARITSEDLQAYLKQAVKGAKDLSVTFSGDQVHLQGKIRVGGLVNADADISGHFGMEGTKLMFLPSNVTVSALGAKYSGFQLARLEVYDFADFPLGIVPDSITMQGDSLTLHGQVS